MGLSCDFCLTGTPFGLPNCNWDSNLPEHRPVGMANSAAEQWGCWALEAKADEAVQPWAQANLPGWAVAVGAWMSASGGLGGQAGLGLAVPRALGQRVRQWED